MKIDDIKQITAADLRVIILALKLEEFNIDDEKVKNDVYERIKRLPSPEHINVLASNSGAIKDLQNSIGHILEIVDKYDARDMDHKVRYKARTGLNPRYKVLEYKRITANKEIKMKKEAAGLVKELVRVSSIVDAKGLGKMSGDLIKCAKSLKDESDTQSISEDLEKIATQLRDAGMDEDADALSKEAGIWSGIKEVGKGVGRGLADMGQRAVEKVKDVGQDYQEQYQLGYLKGTFQKVNQDVTKALDYATKAYGGTQDPVRKQKLGNLLTQLQNMQTVGAQVYNLVMDEEVAAVPEAVAPEVTESLGAPAAAPAAVPEAVPETAGSSLAAGQPVSWTSKGGAVQTATVVGPAAVPGQVIIQYPNGQQMAVSEQKLATACEKYRLQKKS